MTPPRWRTCVSLHAAGRTAMLQPYLRRRRRGGESALLYLGGAFSHSVRKGPLLSAGQEPIPLTIPTDGDDELYDQISPREATADGAAPSPSRCSRLCRAALSGLLYARVDLLPGPDGTPVLLELELTEPSLFLYTAPGSAERLADAVVARARWDGAQAYWAPGRRRRRRRSR